MLKIGTYTNPCSFETAGHAATGHQDARCGCLLLCPLRGILRQVGQWGYPKKIEEVDFLVHGNSENNMDDNWGFPHDNWTPPFFAPEIIEI